MSDIDPQDALDDFFDHVDADVAVTIENEKDPKEYDEKFDIPYRDFYIFCKRPCNYQVFIEYYKSVNFDLEKTINYFDKHTNLRG
jgi:hypothetical protein